jgi:ketosteroid isomerase-like protein
MSTLRRSFLAGLLVLVGMIGLIGAPRALAQEATPAASPCAETSTVENTALVVRFLDASQNVDDAAAADAATATMADVLADDVTYDIPGMTNVPGNDDEIALFVTNAAQFTDFSYEIVKTVAVDDSVAVHFLFHVDGQEIPGATPGATATANAVLFAQITCGQISEFTTVVDTLSLLLQLGLPLMPAMATPSS